MKELLLLITERTWPRQTDVHTAEPLVPEHSFYELEIAIEKIKVNK